MTITIVELDQQHFEDVNRLDNMFIIDSRIVLNAVDGQISYAIEPTEARQKRYPPEPFDLTTYLANSDNVIYLAYLDDRLAGQIRISKHWNRYAYVDDIVVAAEFRRHGVGSALLERAVAWAKAGGFPGIMLESQDINVAACKLYESCGMTLGGFDAYLYKGIDPQTTETAVYWYKIFDTTIDISEQYRTPQNLQARITLHQRFSVNPYGWQRWVFDQLDLPEESQILELGCGPGGLWLENLERIPPGWQITLSDFSAGMLEQTQASLAGQREFRFEKIHVGVDLLPFPAASLEAVIANHMLFHVQDKPGLLAEIQRVLKPGGRLYATTVGQNHLIEKNELHHRFDPYQADRDRLTESFTLENGAEQLQPWFEQIDILRYPDALEVSETEPLVEFILSLQPDFNPEQRLALKKFIQAEMAARHGVIHITKDTGMLIARRLF